MVLYELCRLELPFPDLRAIYGDHVNYEKVDEKQYSQGLRQLIYSCLQKKPSERPTVHQILELPFIKKYEQMHNVEQREQVQRICKGINRRCIGNKHEFKLYDKLLHSLVKERNIIHQNSLSSTMQP